MAAKLGTADVSFRLGATTPAAVYLGSEQVWTAVTPRTLYFVDADDSDWANLNNWFDDPAEGIFASSLPTAVDSVVSTSFTHSNTGGEPTVANFTLNDPDNLGSSLGINLTVTGVATFNGQSSLFATLTGNAVFNNQAANFGTVTGTATFNDSACNAGGTAGTFVPDPPPSCGY